MQVVYIDILFILNLIIDFFIFFISKLILNVQVSLKKIIMGSILAALLYCCTVCIPYLQKGPSILYAFCIPILPIIYMFKPKKIKTFLKCWIVCNLCACLIGGITFNIYYLCGKYTVHKELSIILPISVALGVSCIILMAFSWMRKCFIQPYFEYTLTFDHKGQRLSTKGLLDTGNSLYTVLSYKPVIIVDYAMIKPLLSKKWIQVIEKCKKEGVLKTLSENAYSELQIQVIPFKSVGCKEGLILGMIVEQIEVKRGEHKQHFKQCVIGICYTALFENETYEALLHPDFIRYS